MKCFRLLLNTKLSFITSIMVIVVVCSSILVSGCTTTSNSPSTSTQPIDILSEVTYKYFQVQGDAVKTVQGKFVPPSFSFEYPEIFEKVEYNPWAVYYYDAFHLMFRYPQQRLPGSEISILIQNQLYPDPEETDAIVNSIPFPKKDTISVFGIESDYYEDHKYLENPGYDPYHVVLRLAGFEYQKLNYVISLSYCYRYNEPPEVREMFDRLISTFKILE